MSDKVITMEIVTPERQVLRESAESVVVPAAGGYLGILPGHAPLVTGLQIGLVRYKVEGSERRVAVSGGFMEVAGDRVVILADTAERETEIDVSRAQRSRERATQRLRDKNAGLDYTRAELALKRALIRLKAKGSE